MTEMEYTDALNANLDLLESYKQPQPVIQPDI